MKCTEIEDRLSAWIDGELPEAERAGVEEHLASCSDCARTSEAIRAEDGELRAALAGGREGEDALAEGIIRDLRRPASPPKGRVLWFPLVGAAAAGFLVAFFLYRGEDSRIVEMERRVREMGRETETLRKELTEARKSLPRRDLLCRLQVATGAVEVKAAPADPWAPLATGGGVPAGSWVRTLGKAKCSFAYEDGTEVRLNRDTEVRLADPRRIDLARGQISTRVARAERKFRVQTDQATIEAIGTTLDIAHVWRSAESDEKKAEGRKVTTLAVLEGAARFGDRPVRAGELCRMVDGRLETPRSGRDLLLLTNRWVHEILVLQKGNDRELEKRLNDLLVRIGRTKMEYLYEAEIRAMGDRCALPLARFIQSEVSKKESHRRRKAARILADIAGKEHLPELADLLRDKDPIVRVQMARGLSRVVGNNLGMDERYWGAPSCDADRGAKRWETYLGQADLPWGGKRR